MRAKSFHGAPIAKDFRDIAKHWYKCMLNLSMGLPVAKDVDKPRRINTKTLNEQMHTVTIENIRKAFETCSKMYAKLTKWLPNSSKMASCALDSRG